ncbi:MAG: helix-turn-helix transcriptional regulator [Lachnospiraceae bacterium]|nr:helix-turn-helix transcriptional regulator [Lachnospiraceae bacterium]
MYELDKEKVGKFIAELRKERGMTQKELAEQLKVSDKTVSRWETANGMPDVSMYFSDFCLAR